MPDTKSLLRSRIRGAVETNRFSSGVFSLDVALGGGWPRNKFSLIVGNESTGKTLLSLLAAKSISQIDWETGEFGGFTKTLFVDMEASFDDKWAKKNGWDDRNEIVYPETGEEAVDIVCEAIDTGDYGLIIFDSLEPCKPAKLTERESREGDLPGARARLINEGFTKWLSRLRKYGGPPHKAPSLLFINQYRFQIGQMMGDPRTIPGGRAQLFYASIILSMNGAKIKEDHTRGAFGGVCKKNKTAIPKRNFKFDYNFLSNEDGEANTISNFKGIFNVLKARQIKKVKSVWEFMGDQYKTQAEIQSRIKTEPDFYDKCWKLALQEALNETEVPEVETDGDSSDEGFFD